MTSTWATTQAFVTRWMNRMLGRRPSFIIVGAPRVGKTELVHLLGNTEPDMTYFPTETAQYYPLPGGDYSVTEIPGRAKIGHGISGVLLSKFDLIIFVFDEGREKAVEYWETLWSGTPPAPVVFVGNNRKLQSRGPLIPEKAVVHRLNDEVVREGRSSNAFPFIWIRQLNEDILGTSLHREEQGIIYPYFPVSFNDKNTCKELLRFLSLGSWDIRKGPEHWV